MKFLKYVGKAAVLSSVTAFIFIVGANIWIIKSTQQKLIKNNADLVDNRVALVLGTSSRLVGGDPNPFFHNRMIAASDLYTAGKVSHFILSGDNRTKYYNEPAEMKKVLISYGVPDSIITLDYAGLRTLDSVIRCKEIFGQDKIIIITQPFHSYRALFISNYYEIDAVAFMAQEPTGRFSAQVYVREFFARAKAVLDLYVFKTDPRHLGEKEQIIL